MEIFLNILGLFLCLVALVCAIVGVVLAISWLGVAHSFVVIGLIAAAVVCGFIGKEILDY